MSVVGSRKETFLLCNHANVGSELKPQRELMTEDVMVFCLMSLEQW
jgi:hypothetical protein